MKIAQPLSWLLIVLPVLLTGLSVYYISDETNEPQYAIITAVVAITAGVCLYAFATYRNARRCSHKIADIERVKTWLASMTSDAILPGLVDLRFAQEAASQYSDKPFPHKKFNDSLQEIIGTITYMLDYTTEGHTASSSIMETIDLRIIVQRISRSLDEAAAARESIIMFDGDWPEIGSYPVYADRVKLQRIFSNVISNAIKYAKKGTPISISYEKGDGSHRVTITDHGVGIPGKDQPHIFTKGYRGSNARDDSYGTHSMSLYTVKKLVEECEGMISFTSNKTNGTSFTVTLPIKD